MEFDFIWVDGRETNESWMIQEGRFCNICSISCLSGLPSVTYGPKIFILFFIYFIYFLSWISNPSTAQKVGRKRQYNSWEFWDISCGFCPHIDKWQAPLLRFFCTWEMRKKGFSFNNERRIIWYLETCIWAIAKRCNFTPPFKNIQNVVIRQWDPYDFLNTR